ncbi:MerR family transcriptional regulator [Cellulomonas cellasea]|uniref:DNA-binding transcriptional MerR regulator n=1 Tax=Cellulomonas cellasea TaxID=43670 RepID=A0A7W4YBZ5_9CELL|nr:MerR family transcriptional regulator [Cellulomonas cellasea]MBB2923006.1 DNA-binding transcriptional MerR regulator [Cellulomonas cellasea]
MGMPDDHLLSIGEFSRLSRISVRMLRYYDAHGVLSPARVDPASGYRTYSARALRTADWVRTLRDLGMGVAELTACAGLVDDPAAVRAVLEAQRGRLVREAAAALARVGDVDRLLATLDVPAAPVPVTVRRLPARTVASLRATIPTYADEGVLWQRLYPALAAAGGRPAAPGWTAAVLHDPEFREHDVDVEVLCEVASPFASTDELRCVERPGQDVAVGVLRGPYDAIGATVGAVGAWVAEQGLTFDGPLLDVYVVAPAQDPEPAHWLTEVCVPVTPARPPTDQEP